MNFDSDTFPPRISERSPRRSLNRPSSALLWLLALGLAALGPAAWADDEPGTDSGWALSLGAFDIIDSDKAVELGIEYRFEPFRLWRLDLKPVVGLSATSEGNYWSYGGFRWDIPTEGRWIATLGFAVAAYEEGDGKDLGCPIEFRSSIDLAYRLRSGSRIGLSFYHLSNARIYDLNPGSESLVLTWSAGR